MGELKDAARSEIDLLRDGQYVQAYQASSSSLQRQMDKIVEKSKIPIEEGESELMKMMDASRAIPTTPVIDPNLPRVE